MSQVVGSLKTLSGTKRGHLRVQDPVRTQDEMAGGGAVSGQEARSGQRSR